MFSRTFSAVLLLGYLCAAYGKGPVYKLIYSPPNLATGEILHMSEVQPGLFYALSVQGPSVIFSVTSEGSFKAIYTFSGANNNHDQTMVQGANGLLYGDGYSNASAYYYSLSTSGANFQQYPFPTQPGAWGSGNQTIAAPPGVFYDLAGAFVGTTQIYGIAKIQENGAISILHQLTPQEGAPSHYSAITLGPGGNIYGIANGAYDTFIFRVTPAGFYSYLATLPKAANLAAKWMPLMGASDGNLYGAIPGGGTNNNGEIYQVTPSGQLQTVASFPATGMRQPATLMEAADGNLYGSTNNDAAGSSQIFRYSLSTGQLTKIYEMTGSQGICSCILMEGMDGKLYGAAFLGGPYPGAGTIFSLDIGLPKPWPIVSGLFPSSGPVGQKVIVWGNYLLGATSVSFNGTPASTFLSTSKQSVQVTVPAGAATGPVTVTTANGSFTTTQNFTVQ
jgi:uncharacterized repeat protein (TIGR03803 family)